MLPVAKALVLDFFLRPEPGLRSGTAKTNVIGPLTVYIVFAKHRW